jgi:hypothetical protein
MPGRRWQNWRAKGASNRYALQLWRRELACITLGTSGLCSRLQAAISMLLPPIKYRLTIPELRPFDMCVPTLPAVGVGLCWSGDDSARWRTRLFSGRFVGTSRRLMHEPAFPCGRGSARDHIAERNVRPLCKAGTHASSGRTCWLRRLRRTRNWVWVR